jgi:hypothetical protein
MNHLTVQLNQLEFLGQAHFEQLVHLQLLFEQELVLIAKPEQNQC